MFSLLLMIPSAANLYRYYKYVTAKDKINARGMALKIGIPLMIALVCTGQAIRIDTKHKVADKALEYEQHYGLIYRSMTPYDNE